MRGHLPPIARFLNRTFGRLPDYVLVEHIDSGANGRVYRGFNEIAQSSLAFKVVPVSSSLTPQEEEAYINEARQANRIAHSSIVRYLDAFSYVESEAKYIVFVCDYVAGVSLKRYKKDPNTEINVQFLEEFLQTMFELLYELKGRGMQHGDLHDGNIIVAEATWNVYDAPTFRITDFGIRNLTGPTAHASDYLQMAGILRDLLGRIQYTDCNRRDRYAYDVLRNDFLKRHLIEIDQSVDDLALNPRGLLAKLKAIDGRYSAATTSQPTRLTSPFDYPNCEQIGNSHLLLKTLYSDRLLGLPKIEGRSNLILTGPRGCGKTTVFRALSLDYRTATGDDDPDKLDYLGFYYRCDELYFAFPRYRTPEREDALDIPVHFVTATLLSILLKHIAVWAERHFPKELERDTEHLVRDLWEFFDWKPPDAPHAHRLSTLIRRLEVKERQRAVKKQGFVSQPEHPIEGYLGPGALSGACAIIQDRLTFLRDRHFYFFIDDYSDPKITMDLQANVNRMFMHRTACAFFKLSTESPLSFAREDIDGKKFVESREYELLNIGLRYIRSDPEDVLVFLRDLFSRRFREVTGYPVLDLDTLLGTVERNENASARAVRAAKKQKTKKLDQYWGSGTIAAMCSGDIHYMIRLVGNMVEDFGGQDKLVGLSTTPRIPRRQQNESIRAAAGAFMEAVRTYPGNGPQLAEVVSSFGNVARSYLLYESSGNEGSAPPHQASRIEPYEELRLGAKAEELLRDLVRYSILIEDPRGKSRRGKVVPRFYLRRYLVPHFGLTFSKRDSLQLENREIERLLCDPRGFERDKRLRSIDEAKRRRRRAAPNRLFGSE